MKHLLRTIKRVSKSPELLPVLAVLILGLAASWALTQPGYYLMHDDLQLMRQLAMEECFRDGQIPCRWTRHMGYGFGFPLFNFYPPLPYLVGQGIRLVGFSFVDTAKYAFLLSIILSGPAMYILGREFWGRLGGVLSSVFYIWAPYRAVDVYVRGAMNEAWSFVWFPLALWSSYKLIREAQFRYILILAISWFGLFTSHNLMVLIFIPLFAAWVLLWLLKERSWFTVPQLLIGGLWGFGLAAFFTLPVLLEKKLIHAETLTQGYYNYTVHFVSLYQLLTSRFWGYGPSTWLEEDRMSFQVGHLHWGLSLLLLAAALIFAWKRRKKIRNYLKDRKVAAAVFFFSSAWFAAFMAHLRSIELWSLITPLQFVQFPWRFLTLTTLSFSALAGASVLLFKSKGQRLVLAVLLVASVVLLGKDYFRPESMGPLSDEEKFSGLAWEKQQTAGIYDYLPKTANTAPKEPQTSVADIVIGEGEIKETSQGTNWASFIARISAAPNERATVRINILYFPEWRVFVDGEERETFIPEEEDWGRPYIRLPVGEHKIYARLYDTPVRTAGNLISLISWLALFTAPIWRRR